MLDDKELVGTSSLNSLRGFPRDFKESDFEVEAIIHCKDALTLPVAYKLKTGDEVNGFLQVSALNS